MGKLSSWKISECGYCGKKRMLKEDCCICGDEVCDECICGNTGRCPRCVE